MSFSEFKYRRIYAAWKLRRWWVVPAMLLPFALLGLLGLYVHGGREIIAVTPAKLTSITGVPEHEYRGYDAAAPTPWMVEVEFASGRKEEAEFPLRPRIGRMVCVVESSAPLRGPVYEVIGYIDALAVRGRKCERSAATN